MSRPLVIWGAGWHAATVVDILQLRGEDSIVGFLDDVNPERQGAAFCGRPILGGAEQLDSLRERGVDYVLVAIGDCRARLRLAQLARAKGYHLATAVHPRAVITDGVPIGAGTVVKAAVVIGAGVTIGENVLISAGSIVGHACVLNDGVRLASGVTVAGNVTIGRGTWIGAGATVIDRLTIGEHSIIGAGAVVVRDVPDRVVAYGVPARVVRKVAE